VLGDSLVVEDPILLYSQTTFFLLQVSQGSPSLLLVHCGRISKCSLTNVKTEDTYSSFQTSTSITSNLRPLPLGTHSFVRVGNDVHVRKICWTGRGDKMASIYMFMTGPI
jgi:hypothetical protein